MATRVLYKAADGSWRAAEPRAGIRRLYTLKQGERWALLDDDRVMVVSPARPPKVAYPDGCGEGIPPSGRASAISAKTTNPYGHRPKAGESQRSTSI